MRSLLLPDDFRRFDDARLVLGREAFRYAQGDLAGRSPFGGAGEDGLEADAVKCGKVGVTDPEVAHRRGHHATLVEQRPPDHGFVHLGAAELLLRESAFDDIHVIRATAHAAVEFVGRVKPLGWQVFHDGVRGIPGLEDEIVFGAVSGTKAFGSDFFLIVGDADGFAGRIIDGDALAEVGPAPACANHLVEVIPARESVVRRVDIDEAAAVEYEVGERIFHVGAPFRAVVIIHDDLVVRELRHPPVPLGSMGTIERCLFGVPGFHVGVESFFGGGIAGLGFRWLGFRKGGGGGGYRDGEETRCFERGLARFGGAEPVVIIAAVEDEDADLFGRAERKGQKGE